MCASRQLKRRDRSLQSTTHSSRQVPASLFGALVFFVCEARGGGFDEVDRMGRHRFQSTRFRIGAPPPAVLRHMSSGSAPHRLHHFVACRPIFGLEAD